MKQEQSDESLVKEFFAAHTEAIEDGGFTARVVAALPAAESSWVVKRSRLRCWNRALDLLAAVSVVVFLVYFDASDWIQRFTYTLLHHIVIGIAAFDVESLLVRMMLFLHRLPAALPTAEQTLVVVVLLAVLLVLGMQRVVRTVSPR